MTLKITYFASLREQLGREQDLLNIDAPTSVSDIWAKVTGEPIIPNKILVALNHEYVEVQTLVQPDDELAFFPPVTGG